MAALHQSIPSLKAPKKSTYQCHIGGKQESRPPSSYNVPSVTTGMRRIKAQLAHIICFSLGAEEEEPGVIQDHPTNLADEGTTEGQRFPLNLPIPLSRHSLALPDRNYITKANSL